MSAIRHSTVRTTDGYTLYRRGDGKWVDNLDPSFVDLTFDSGPDGYPIDTFGERLDVADPESQSVIDRFINEP